MKENPISKNSTQSICNMGLLDICSKLHNRFSMIQQIINDGYMYIWCGSRKSRIKFYTCVKQTGDGLFVTNSEYVDASKFINLLEDNNMTIIMSDSKGRKINKKLNIPMLELAHSLYFNKGEIRIGIHIDDD